jgi:primosomal protein N' (replication factor Y)
MADTAPAVRVGVPVPLDRRFDYAVPEGMEVPAPGTLVRVPFGKNEHLGVVWDVAPGEEMAPGKLKPLLDLPDEPPLAPGLRRFIERAADYTLTPFGMMLRMALRCPGLGAPPPERQAYASAPDAVGSTKARARVLSALAEMGGAPLPPGVLAAMAGVSPGVLRGMEAEGTLRRVTLPRDTPYPPFLPESGSATLSPAQAEAAAALRAGVSEGCYATTLLRGVTGAGKTEVYLEAVTACLRAGRQALVLVPEIALTGGFRARLADRLGTVPPEWHSEVAPAERRRLWHAAAKGDAALVIGARSALFLPFADLGLIVVDEEHDAAYKQEDGALYHARDMAVLRGATEGAQVVLASATPSLETWVNARAGKYARLDLPERFGPAVLPQVTAIDLRRDGPEKGRWIAPPLVTAIAERLKAGEQALLFLNRRGYAPLTICRGCGHMMECPDCDARLVEHRFRRRLICHQCGHEAPIPDACPACGAVDRLAAVGPGVERLAEEAQALFPEARLSILSSDMAEGPAALRARIAMIAEGGADLVIGTQIVAKGHNFPLLTLVGVIDADLGLQNGDLRAAERTFQMLHQVAGRAGRAARPGAAMIQTACPEHPVMQAILSGEVETFLEREAAGRRQAGVPPFGRMAAVILSGPKEPAVWEAGQRLAAAHAPLSAVGARLLGPVAAPIARIRGRFRVRMLVKAPRTAALHQALRTWVAAAPPPASVRLSLDMDPQSFL